MLSLSTELKNLVTNFYTQLNQLNKEELSFKPGPLKWSKKEILGHLIDSAQNNIRRFIVSQYEHQPHIVYRQDDWVKINSYQSMDVNALTELWYFQNQQIVHLLEQMNSQQLEKTCLTESFHTVGWLAADYIKHLRHHMHQVLNLEEVAYP